MHFRMKFLLFNDFPSYNKEKLYSVRSLVVVHIVNFQRDLVVMRFIRIELIFSTSKVERIKVRIVRVRDVL